MQNSDIPSYSNTSFDVSLLLPHQQIDSSNSIHESIQDIESFFKKFPIQFEVIQCLDIREGLERSSGKYIFCLDLYLSTPLAEVFQSIQTFYESPEVQFIFGNRNQLKKKSRGKKTAKESFFEKCIYHKIQSKLIENSADIFCPYIAFQNSQKENVLKNLHKKNPYYQIAIQKIAIEQNITRLTQNIHWLYPPFEKNWGELLKILLFVRF